MKTYAMAYCEDHGGSAVDKVYALGTDSEGSIWLVPNRELAEAVMTQNHTVSPYSLYQSGWYEPTNSYSDAELEIFEVEVPGVIKSFTPEFVKSIIYTIQNRG